MKWLNAMLLSFLFYWATPSSEREFAAKSDAEVGPTEWLIRFSGDEFQPYLQWPEGIRQMSIHAPIHSIIIQSSLNEEQLRRQLKSIHGIIRIERGRYDKKGSPVYATGMAILEPENAGALNFLRDIMLVEPSWTLDALGWWVIDIPSQFSFEEFRSRCISSGHFKQVHRDEAVQGKSEQTNDPMFSSSWHIQQANDADVDATEAWNLLPANAAIKSIAIIEGVGFDTLNMDLSGRFIDRFNTTNNTSNVYANTSNEKHGTATSGIPCAIANNATSSAGLGYNKLKVQAIRIGYNVTSAGNFTSTSVMQVAAINRAMAQSTTAAISMSISFTTYQSAMQNAINNARLQGRSNKGIPVFASSGNSGLSSWTNYPASYAGVIAVGATTSSDVRASFSNYGSGITLAAPGNSIATTDITGANGYSVGDNTYFSGTSAACPVAATVGALMIVMNEQLTETQIKQKLAVSCDKVGGYNYGTNATHSLSTWCNEIGYGRINMHSALLAASGTTINLPDITVTSVSVSTSTPQVNQPITINCNQQIAPSGFNSTLSTIEYRYSGDAVWSTDDLVIGNNNSTLGNGISSEAESITFNIPAGSGTKYILIKADALSSVAESNESNNIATIAITIAGSTSASDVFINNPQCSSTNAIVGQSITISCTHSISGTNNTIYPSLQYRLSTDAVWQSTDTYIGSDVSTLNATVLNEAENITYTIPNQLGTRYILIKADAGNSISESNENNNVAVIPITISAAVIAHDPSYNLEHAHAPSIPDIRLYPNPTNEVVTIETIDFNWKTLHVVTLDGRVLLRRTRSEWNRQYPLNVSELTRGAYVIVLSDDSNQLSRQLLVE